MKTATTALTALSLFALLATSSAWAVDQARTNAGDNWAEHVRLQAAADMPARSATPGAMPSSSAGTTLGPHAKLFGSLAAVHTASRTIALTPGLRYINVASGETVAFKSGTEEIAWTFAEFVHGSTVDLGVLFPAFPNAKGVRAYIERSEVFTGG